MGFLFSIVMQVIMVGTNMNIDDFQSLSHEQQQEYIRDIDQTSLD